MRKLFEKVGLRGAGEIAGVIAIAIIIWQLWDVVAIPWLSVSIALDVIFAAMLVLAAIRIRKWKHKYKSTRTQLEMTKESMAKNIEAQRFPLQGQNYMLNLDIDNALLTKLYEQAYSHAITESDDAKLNGISIVVNPYQGSDGVSILFRFYSRMTDKECTYILGKTGDMAEPPPGEPAKREEDRVTFDELPWVKYSGWSEFIRKSCQKVPLSQTGDTFYHVFTFAHLEPQWSICFKDGMTGKESILSWDGKGDPIPQEQGEGGKQG